MELGIIRTVICFLMFEHLVLRRGSVVEL
jgi:hypothetical protein